MSHITESGAINSGAINHVSFPGSEDGLSLIQLLGAVSGLGSITGVTLRKIASATTAPSAVARAPAIVIRSRLSATATGEAIASAAQYGKAPRTAVTTAGPLVRTAGVRLRIKFAVARTASAVAAPTAITTRGLRGAINKGEARAQVTSVKKAFLSAQTKPAANTYVFAKAGAIRFAIVKAAANSYVTAGRKLRFSGNADPEAVTALLATSARLAINAQTIATIADDVLPYLALRRTALGAGQADAVLIASRALVHRSAQRVSTASSRAAAALRIPLGASVTASFASFTAALDYSITPAPGDRQMVVPLEERQMEVVAS